MSVAIIVFGAVSILASAAYYDRHPRAVWAAMAVTVLGIIGLWAEYGWRQPSC